MLGIVFSLFSVFLLVFMLYKKINAHMALLLSGLLLLSLAAIFGLSPHIVTKDSLNLGFFDIFQVFNQTMSKYISRACTYPYAYSRFFCLYGSCRGFLCTF